MAMRRIEALELTCKWMPGGWVNKVNDRTPFYFCQRQVGKVVLTRWQVSFLFDQDKVVVVRTNVGLLGP
jgi:hypothetical protein